MGGAAIHCVLFIEWLLDAVLRATHTMLATTAGAASGVADNAASGNIESITASALELISSYTHIFVIAFLVTLLSTPIIRRIAIAADVIDHPDDSRKAHPYPVAYLGGIAVLLGLLAAIAASYVYMDGISGAFAPVPIAIVIGMLAISITGMADDVWGWDPRLKIAGQLVAAAALAIENVGVRVAEGLLVPALGGSEELFMTIGPVVIENGHVFYWFGTAIIAIFVLGGCNAANLIDGLDGLLSGVTSVVALGLLAICLMMAMRLDPMQILDEDGSLAGARLVLCVALLGTALGFLPHNFNPATIFLGDCGSLLIGYISVVIILMLGERGETHLVFAGLIIFSIPIMDTTLAIIRRWLARAPMSSSDDQHIHHQLLRSVGSVKRAVLSLYTISTVFAVIGVALAALVMWTGLRVRILYAFALLLFSFIGVLAVKAARRQQLQLETASPAKDKHPAVSSAASRHGTTPSASREQAMPTRSPSTSPSHPSHETASARAETESQPRHA